MELKDTCSIERKSMTDLDIILKSRGITFLIKVNIVKAMVFQVVRYGCECWTIKKAECQRIDAFKLWCWRRLLRVPWTVWSRRSNHSSIKEISSKFSLEGRMLKLKFQYFGHLMGRTDSFEKTLMLGKIEGGNERLLLNHKRCRDSWPPEKNSIWDQRWGLISQSFCVIKFY